MTREEIIEEFRKAEINFDYTTLKTHDIAVNYIDDTFTPVLDLVEKLVNKTNDIHDVSYCDDCVVKTEKVELETCNTCPFNKNK